MHTPALRRGWTGKGCVFCRWLPDELGDVSFAKLQDLKPLPVAAYDGRHDIWTIEAQLSEGCAGPSLPEEVML